VAAIAGKHRLSQNLPNEVTTQLDGHACSVRSIAGRSWHDRMRSSKSDPLSGHVVLRPTRAIGEAKPCSFDGVYMEMHCFPPTQEALAAPKHENLVDADFEKPVKFDARHWAGGAYPYPDAFLAERWHCYECDGSHRAVSLVSLLYKGRWIFCI
jgi:hypothetical protein